MIVSRMNQTVLVIGRPEIQNPRSWRCPNATSLVILDKVYSIMIAFKSLLSFLLLSVVTVLALDQAFVLEEEGTVRIVCANTQTPQGVCKANGEVANMRTTTGVTLVSHGNGVCIGCPTNQPADTYTCEEASACTCLKCNTTVDDKCTETIGACQDRNAPSDGSSSSIITSSMLLVFAATCTVLML